MGKVGAIGAVAVAVVLVAGCGSGKSDDKAAATSTTAAATSASKSKGRECTADDIKVDGGFGQAPEITIPDDCDPPKQLIVKDLVAGSGPGAETGQQLSMNYTLVTWSDKKVLDSSFTRGQTFDLTLGSGKVIKGWEQGLVGVQQGARRLLIVPPDLGYGAGGRGIKPYETLVFVTDAVKG
ncbi:peptidylprolyl isomerase [Nocardia seriolae]|nr:peptidylprolyl isomerase [Nocardia seriolae]